MSAPKWCQECDGYGDLGAGGICEACDGQGVEPVGYCARCEDAPLYPHDGALCGKCEQYEIDAEDAREAAADDAYDRARDSWADERASR